MLEFVGLKGRYFSSCRAPHAQKRRGKRRIPGEKRKAPRTERGGEGGWWEGKEMEERSRGIRRVPVLSLSTEEVMGWRWDFDGSKVADGWTRVLSCQATDGLHSVRGVRAGVCPHATQAGRQPVREQRGPVSRAFFCLLVQRRMIYTLLSSSSF